MEEKRNIINVLEKYGDLEQTAIQSELYIYRINVKKITEDRLLQKLSSIVLIISIKKDDPITFYLFCIYGKEQYKNDIVDIVNKTNAQLEYGKFYVDAEGDVNWNCSLPATNVTEEDVKNILESMLRGIVKLALRVSEND